MIFAHFQIVNFLFFWKWHLTTSMLLCYSNFS